MPIYDDIGAICEHNPEPVDALIGSPPCQPFSYAGEMCGTDDARHLYPAFLAVVRKLRPRYVLMEQVTAILSLDGGRAFGEYIGGLVALGYDLVWHCIPASAVGAPHERDRLWLIAHAKRGERGQKSHNGQAGRMGRKFQPVPWNCGWQEALRFLRGVDDGSAYWVDRLDSIRNTVVPQIPFLIGQAINQIERR